MKGLSRRLGVAILLAVSIPVGSAALAWACSPQAYVAMSPDTGNPRSASTVRGTSFDSSQVKITWGSATGPQLATAQGPSFNVPVVIPDAQPGVYYIVATVTSNGQTFTAKTPYEVTAPEAAPASGGVTSPPVSGGSTSPPASGDSTQGGSPAAGDSTSGASGSSSSPTSGAPAASAVPARTPSRTGSSAPASHGAARLPTSRRPARGDRPAQSTSPLASARAPGARPHVARPAARATPSGAPVAVKTRSGRVVFGDSVGVAGAGRATRAAPSGSTPASPSGSTPASPSGDTPSQQSLALGDLSQGFGSPSKSLLVPGVSSGAAHADPAGTPLTAGMILLGTGLIALFGSFLVAGVRRRRSLADGSE